MSSSSPSSFALNHRRRSHSASSPSPSPAPASSWRPAHKRAHSSHRDAPTLPDPQRCPLDIWRTGKRLRRDISPARATRSSTPASADSRTTSSSSSAPHTPLFPAPSADFFSSHPFCGGNLSSRTPRSPSSAVPFLHDESSESELTRLRSTAFSELQRSVQENGEGFVMRMREFEDSRSKSVQYSRARGIERRRRKRHSPSVSTTGVTRKSIISDDDDDVLILSSALGAQLFHPRQKRSASLGAMDDTTSQLHNETNSSGRLSPIFSISHSFPFSHYTTSHAHLNTANQPAELSASFSTSFDFANPSHSNTFKPALSHSSDSLASAADLSLSISSAQDTCYISSSPMISPPQSPCHRSVDAIPTSASSAEKAIEALTLAMASGAGGLGDYEAVRVLNVLSADESQVGELWH